MLVLSISLLQANDQGRIPLWLWILIILILVLLIVWAILSSRRQDEPSASAPKTEEESLPQVPDDLSKVEGIGPKISSTFQAAGITTFAKLAETSIEDLQAILDEAGIRLGNPETWPEQAKLAATNNWDALEKLKDELQGGRRD